MTNINWYPGHMAKTKREIRENLKFVDVVYEVIDARIPYSSKMQDMEKVLLDKPRILIMTKIDLCDIIETEKWKKYYEAQGYVVIFANLSETFNSKELINETKKIVALRNEKRESKGLLVTKSRVLVVGIPNVGKSTLINRLSLKKAVNAGNKPGMTKKLSWIRINKDLELMDSPGILWPKLEPMNIALNLAAFTAIKEEIIPIFRVIEFFLENTNKYYPELLATRYGITEFNEDMIVNLEIIGKRRGALIKGGDIDFDRVLLMVLNDIKSGLIGRITMDRVEDYV